MQQEEVEDSDADTEEAGAVQSFQCKLFQKNTTSANGKRQARVKTVKVVLHRQNKSKKQAWSKQRSQKYTRYKY